MVVVMRINDVNDDEKRMDNDKIDLNIKLLKLLLPYAI